MSRAAWKVPYIDSLFLSKKFLLKKSVKIWTRNSVIPARFITKSFYVHNGRRFLPVLIRSDMVGHKFGEFALTKVLGHFRKKTKKKFRKK